MTSADNRGFGRGGRAEAVTRRLKLLVDGGGAPPFVTGVGLRSKIALRTAASPTHEVACRDRQSDRGRPLRDHEGGGRLPEKMGPKKSCRIADDRDSAGPGALCFGWD